MIYEFPWPDPKLSPNKRGHWATKQSAKDQIKRDWFFVGKSSPIPEFSTDKIYLLIKFYPPDNRWRDLDNMLASCKYGLDALAKAWGVNDRRFRPIPDVGLSTPHGQVTIQILHGFDGNFDKLLDKK